MPDEMIAEQLGVTVEQLQRDCPRVGLPPERAPFGLDRDTPPRRVPHPHGHDSAPLDLTPPAKPYHDPIYDTPSYRYAPPASVPADDGSALALLVFVLLLGG